MIQYLAIAGFLGIVLSEIFSKKDLKFDNEKIDAEEILNLDKKEKYTGYYKQIISRRITRLLNQNNENNFKIGKSGTENRIKNYKKVKKMYILAASKKKEKINELEAYYTAKYQKHKKCLNKNKGTAGNMTEANGYYFLYIVFFV